MCPYEAGEARKVARWLVRLPPQWRIASGGAGHGLWLAAFHAVNPRPAASASMARSISYWKNVAVPNTKMTWSTFC